MARSEPTMPAMAPIRKMISSSCLVWFVIIDTLGCSFITNSFPC
jgi:hypothetical protein